MAKRSVRPRRRPAARKRASHSNPWLVIRHSRIHGRGAFARTDIPAGTRLIEYTGEHISNREADRRYDDARMKRHHTFLFILTRRTVVDGAVHGNQSRFINHSCAPNCEAIIEGKHIWIDALRDIRRGEELAYDYRYGWVDGYTVDDLAFYRCGCGSADCRGTIVMVPASRRHLLRQLRARKGNGGRLTTGSTRQARSARS